MNARVLAVAAGALLSSCILVNDFDPEGLPCDSESKCLGGYRCEGGVCVAGEPVDETTPVAFEVAVPAETPELAAIRLVGDDPALGGTGLQLTHDGAGLHTGQVRLRVGKTITYSVRTSGAAAMREQDLNGQDVSHTFVVTENAIEKITVARWSPQEITFNVTVPAFTPSTATICLTGNRDELGPWNPAGKRMVRTGTTAKVVVAFSGSPSSIEYKYTLCGAAFADEEQDSRCEDIANRVLDPLQKSSATDAVGEWRGSQGFGGTCAP